jgi:hypothetical protein
MQFAESRPTFPDRPRHVTLANRSWTVGLLSHSAFDEACRDPDSIETGINSQDLILQEFASLDNFRPLSFIPC